VHRLEVASFLTGALALAQEEEQTTTWFAIRIGPSTFGVFDAFPDEGGRDAHLNGQIAVALMGSVGTLIEAPTIEKGRHAGGEAGLRARSVAAIGRIAPIAASRGSSRTADAANDDQRPAPRRTVRDPAGDPTAYLGVMEPSAQLNIGQNATPSAI